MLVHYALFELIPFERENVMAVVILRQVSATRMSKWWKQVIKDQKFYDLGIGRRGVSV